MILTFCVVFSATASLGQEGSSPPGPYKTNLPLPNFGDMRVNYPDDYVRLIRPGAPTIVKLAKKFKTIKEAYKFVSEEIKFAPFAPSGPVWETLRHRMGSCLGKAALLTSIYRAMGVPAGDVRIVMGLIIMPQGPVDHVWVDMEYKGQSLQQDPSGMLGKFGFGKFPDNGFVDAYVMKEIYCFNDKEFALISQLNRMRGSMPDMRK